MTAWSVCCGFYPDEDVIEIVDDCLHYGSLTMYSVSAEFREKMHRLCLSLGIVSKSHSDLGGRRGVGMANVTMSLPEGFIWVVADFDKVKMSNAAYEASKSSKRFDYAMNMRIMNKAYPGIRDLIVKFDGKHCSPWSRCLGGMRRCSSCSGADDDVMKLHPTVRRACVDRLVAEGIVNTEWGHMMPTKRLTFIDEYA